MPVSHIGLTVSHLATSCSFFLEALKPLGYKYVGQQGNQIGFGVNGEDADFFICQESHGNKAGAAHIAFSAPFPAAVDDFHARALHAGGKDHGRPSVRDVKSGYYSAAVLDFDGNSIEVVCRKKLAIEDGHADDTRSQVSNGSSRVLSWQKDVVTRRSRGSVASARDDHSVASSNPISPGPAMGTTTATTTTNAGTSTGLIGALIGVAAGAAAAAAYLENAKASESATTTTVPRTNTLAIESSPTSPRTVVDLGPTSYYAPPSTVNIRPGEGSTASRAPSIKTRAIEAPPARRDNYVWEQRPASVARSSPSRASHNPYGQHSARVSEVPETIVSSFYAGSTEKSNRSRHAKASTVVSGRDVPLPGSSVASRSSTSLDRPVEPGDSISQVSTSRSSHRHHHGSGRNSSGASKAKSYRPGSEASSSASSQRTARPTTTVSVARTLPVRSSSASRATPTKGRSIVSYSAHGSGARILGFRLGGEKPTSGGSMIDGSPAGFQLWEERRADN